MTIASLLDPVTGQPGTARLSNASAWMQGRTLYGGASALVAYTMAVRAFPGLPPLRAGQVAFVAPVGEEIELSAEIIRQGRNVTQVRSEIRADGKVALSAFWPSGTKRSRSLSRSSSALWSETAPTPPSLRQCRHTPLASPVPPPPSSSTGTAAPLAPITTATG